MYKQRPDRAPVARVDGRVEALAGGLAGGRAARVDADRASKVLDRPNGVTEVSPVINRHEQVYGGLGVIRGRSEQPT